MLHSGGLDIGQRLGGGARGNVKGFYEDLDFHELHLQILESQGIHFSGFTLQRDLPIREQHLLVARALVEERRRRRLSWGWKDPRTTLFLDFWQQIVSEANFLIVYRCPWDVVDSLFRRGDPVFFANPSFAVRVWTHYNQLLLDFHDRFPERSLCVNSYRAVDSPALLLDALRSKFSLNLRSVADLYDASLLHRTNSLRWASLLRHHFPEAVDLYEQLNERASRTVLRGASLAGSPATSLPTEDWACQDWLNLRVLEEQYRELLTQREKSETELSCVREKSETELSCARHELAEVQAEQASLRERLEQTRWELEQKTKELDQAQIKLCTTRERVANMESSKFWKLRMAWMVAKHSLRRAG
jgi:hypothetical protein